MDSCHDIIEINVTGAGIALCCFVTIVVTTVILLTTLFQVDLPNEPCNHNITLGEIVRNEDEYIGLVFTNCPNQALLEAFQEAASTWSSIITQNSLIPSSIGNNGIRASRACSFLNDDAQVSGNFELDFLLIFVDLTFFDGVGGVLGEAGPCVRDDNGKPIIAGMSFESADLRQLGSSSDSLKTLIRHEMAHTLGFGVDWLRSGVLRDPIFPSSSSVNVENVPKFVGQSALEQYKGLGATDATFVPLEDGRENGVFKLFTPPSTGRGSIDVHWKRENFGFELMVATLRTDGTKYPLSVVTLGSLVDLGYSVDFSKAEPFSLPSESFLTDKKEEVRFKIVDIDQKSISEFS